MANCPLPFPSAPCMVAGGPPQSEYSAPYDLGPPGVCYQIHAMLYQEAYELESAGTTSQMSLCDQCAIIGYSTEALCWDLSFSELVFLALT